MAYIHIAAFLGLLAMVGADVNEIVGNNQYLPPSKGYNYDRPSVPFSPSARPPTPSYRPPPPSPSYNPSTPSYQPPSPTYAPAAPRPTVISRPSAPAPIYTPGTAPSASNGVAVGIGGGDHHDHDHHEPGMPYDFEYKVKDDYYGTDYSRNEVSDGDVIRGEYRVQLPDGRLQIVKYTADWKNGYNADVSYQGEPQYPANTGSASGVSNSYGPPPSSSGSAPSNSYGPPRTGY